jgi:hypothetical protein
MMVMVVTLARENDYLAFNVGTKYSFFFTNLSEFL